MDVGQSVLGLLNTAVDLGIQVYDKQQVLEQREEALRVSTAQTKLNAFSTDLLHRMKQEQQPSEWATYYRDQITQKASELSATFKKPDTGVAFQNAILQDSEKTVASLYDEADRKLGQDTIYAFGNSIELASTVDDVFKNASSFLANPVLVGYVGGESNASQLATKLMTSKLSDMYNQQEVNGGARSAEEFYNANLAIKDTDTESQKMIKALTAKSLVSKRSDSIKLISAENLGKFSSSLGTVMSTAFLANNFTEAKRVLSEQVSLLGKGALNNQSNSNTGTNWLTNPDQDKYMADIERYSSTIRQVELAIESNKIARENAGQVAHDKYQADLKEFYLGRIREMVGSKTDVNVASAGAKQLELIILDPKTGLDPQVASSLKGTLAETLTSVGSNSGQNFNDYAKESLKSAEKRIITMIPKSIKPEVEKDLTLQRTSMLRAVEAAVNGARPSLLKGEPDSETLRKNINAVTDTFLEMYGGTSASSIGLQLFTKPEPGKVNMVTGSSGGANVFTSLSKFIGSGTWFAIESGRFPDGSKERQVLTNMQYLTKGIVKQIGEYSGTTYNINRSTISTMVDDNGNRYLEIVAVPESSKAPRPDMRFRIIPTATGINILERNPRSGIYSPIDYARMAAEGTTEAIVGKDMAK